MLSLHEKMSWPAGCAKRKQRREPAGPVLGRSAMMLGRPRGIQRRKKGWGEARWVGVEEKGRLAGWANSRKAGFRPVAK
jgi:hypothetical protein